MMSSEMIFPIRVMEFFSESISTRARQAIIISRTINAVAPRTMPWKQLLPMEMFSSITFAIRAHLASGLSILTILLLTAMKSITINMQVLQLIGDLITQSHTTDLLLTLMVYSCGRGIPLTATKIN